MDLAAELAAYGPGVHRPPVQLSEAGDYCRRLAQSHYENFTVASWLFPRNLRQHLCNVYAYCRWADDLADEAAGTSAASGSEGRLHLLEWWEQQLNDVYRDVHPHPGPLPEGEGANARPSLLPEGEGETQPRHPVFIALAETIRQFDLPRQPLADLLAAFRRDQVQTRYDTFEDLLTYCRCSANPVGRIVLHLGQSSRRVGRTSPGHVGRGSSDPALLQWSDSICTGLQLANFCQDVRRDFENGRIYLPLAECRAHGWDEAKFAAGICDDAFQELLAAQVARAEQFLRAGEPLARTVGSDLRLPVRLFIEGGLAVLAAIRRARYDVWSERPTVGRATKLRLLARAWWQSCRAAARG